MKCSEVYNDFGQYCFLFYIRLFFKSYSGEGDVRLEDSSMRIGGMPCWPGYVAKRSHVMPESKSPWTTGCQWSSGTI